MLFILIPTNKQISILNLYALNKANKKLPIGQGFQSRGAIPAAGTALGHKLQLLQCSLTAFPRKGVIRPPIQKGHLYQKATTIFVKNIFYGFCVSLTTNLVVFFKNFKARIHIVQILQEISCDEKMKKAVSRGSAVIIRRK